MRRAKSVWLPDDGCQVQVQISYFYSKCSARKAAILKAVQYWLHQLNKYFWEKKLGQRYSQMKLISIYCVFVLQFFHFLWRNIKFILFRKPFPKQILFDSNIVQYVCWRKCTFVIRRNQSKEIKSNTQYIEWLILFIASWAQPDSLLLDTQLGGKFKLYYIFKAHVCVST